jgi:hypothetical protein
VGQLASQSGEKEHDDLMRVHILLALALAAPSLSFAQSNAAPTNADPDRTNVARELRALREALAEQQEQTKRQQLEIEKLEQQLAQSDRDPDVTQAAEHATVRMVNTELQSSGDVPVVSMTGGSGERQEVAPRDKDSPLSFSIGGVQFTPGGTIDFTSVFRTTNVGSGLGTTFGAIPFNNTVQGQLTEDRLSAQNSKVTLKAKGKFGANDFTGYLETDFIGNDAANVFVTTNGHTDRLRLYWLEVKRGKWEIMGGQTWSWLTPNRIGLSPNPADIFAGLGVDANSMAGLTWTRAAEFRVVYHPDEHWGFGVALENPQQFVGAGEVIYPFAFNAALGLQFDAANNTATPNLHPDVIPKLAYDTTFGSHQFHFEAVGLLSSVSIASNVVTGAKNTATGGGGSVNLNFEIVKNVRLFANTFYSDGGGRYIGGLGPDAVVRPDANVPPLPRVSLVHSGSGIAGLEAQWQAKNTFGTYYSGAYFQRNFFPDVTSMLAVRPFVGFGGPNSPNSANRAIQQATFDWIHTFWKSSQYGALQTLTQYSYLTRSPWFVAAGAPKNAHASMVYVDFRYVVP